MRDHRDRTFRSEEVARSLSSTPSSIEIRLGDLAARGFLGRDEEGTYSYTAKDDVDEDVRMTSDAYAKRKTTIIELIFSGPSESVRGFSDAFKFRKDD